jgi:hypothetical protein
MSDKLQIRRYEPQNKSEWDALVKASAGGTFLFLRDYMEYHAHRFTDYSLMIYNESRLLALLPATRHDEEVVSHGGLTYGGFVALPELTSMQMLKLFEVVATYMREQGIRYWYYKPVPYIYQCYPHAAEQYALYIMGAKRTACNLSSAIDLSQPLKYAQLRRRGIKRAVKSGVNIAEWQDFGSFWFILEANLQERHGVSPVHTRDEMVLLQERFPHNIKLHTACIGDRVVAGCVVYNTGIVAHVQYISASPEGKECGALDYLFDYLIEQEYSGCKYFDFGISTEQNGMKLNTGLLSQKEGFGARGVLYETYCITL